MMFTHDQPQIAEGGCHCGAIRFTVKLRELKAIQCNCSICRRKGFLHYIVPPEDFNLLQGEAHLHEYRFNTKTAQHLFCKDCGIHAFYRPRSHPEHWDVNLNCLDDTEHPDFLQRFSIQPFNGKLWEDNIHTIRKMDTDQNN